jgi:cellulose synthase/poly-beta-1,6-N-acetylglucosamine synthase-like glycosyltransferase
MTTAAGLLLCFLALGLFLPAAVLFAECAAALLPERPPLAEDASRNALRVVVLIPAYDEATVLRRTLEGVLPELGAGDQVLVVADNCTDDTAAIARASGAEVLERVDPKRRGKGFALDAGIAHLAASPPDVVVVLDADCHVVPGSIRRLADCASRFGRPAQAEDLLTVPERATPLARVSALAFLVRNHVRPTGLRHLGLPCHLMGTGMAFPWNVIRDAPAAGPHLAEDIQMGIALASLGFAPMYCPGARITSSSPERASAARGQRRRWEHGHMSTLLDRAPRLIWRGLARRQPHLLTMGLDLIVPPLALLVVLLLGGIALALAFTHGRGSTAPLMLFSSALILVLGAVFIAWFRFGRTTLPARYIALVPLYVAWKIPLYLSFAVRGPYATWERAERSPSASGF